MSRVSDPECPVCGRSEDILEAPEAGYWTCLNCLERGSGPAEDVNWWINDPNSQWHADSEDDDQEIRTESGHSSSVINRETIEFVGFPIAIVLSGEYMRHAHEGSFPTAAFLVGAFVGAVGYLFLLRYLHETDRKGGETQ